ncbi:MAG: CbiX/SirB N-terminal domain-containing protein [Pseudanabaena sp. ELA607]
MPLSLINAATPPRRIFLVTHGSSDPRSWDALQNLVQAVQAAYPHWQIGGGCLEGQPQTLAQQMITFSETSFSESTFRQTAGHQVTFNQGKTTGKIHVVPLFLLSGTHVMVDIPEQVQQAKASLISLNRDLDLEILPYLGAHPELPAVLATNFLSQAAPAPDSKRLLIAHGSRRQSANEGIRQLAAQVNATASFWAATPSWEEQLHLWQNEGVKNVVILPYFLVAGGITEIIASKVNNPLNLCPDLHLELLPLPFSAETIIMLINSLFL